MRVPQKRYAWYSGTFAAVIAIALFRAMSGHAASVQFTESFTTTVHRDGATTATWDTARREVRLPESGTAWAALGALDGKSVTALTFSPAFAQDAVAFAGVADGIFRTTDSGGTWQRVATVAQPVESIALSPAFAGNGVGFAMTNGDGLWRSSDSGATWAKVDSANGFAVVVSPAFAADQTAFAAGFDGVRKSTDGGITWTIVTTGMESEVIENGDIRGVAISPTYATDQTAYATTFSFGVYRTTDGGATWTLANPSHITISSASVIATGSGGAVAVAFYEGVYVQQSSGAPWVNVRKGSARDLQFSPLFSTDGVLLIAAEDGVTRWSGSPMVAGGPLADGWSGAALAIGIAPTYPASGSVLAGSAGGASRTQIAFASSAVAVSTSVDTTDDLVTRATLTSAQVLPSGTAMTYELSAALDGNGQPRWEGPVTLGSEHMFTNSGSHLRWRATLTTTDAAATPVLTGVTIAYETVAFLAPPEPTGGTPTATSIQWAFEGGVASATAYEIRTGDQVVASRTGGVTSGSITESGLQPNTEYCARRIMAVRNAERSAASPVYPCTVTVAAAPMAPAVSEVTSSSARIVLPSDGNPSDTEYAIRDGRSGQYADAQGTLRASPIWRTRAAWGAGTVAVQGLVPETEYAFCLRARNRAQQETACTAAEAVRTPSVPQVRGALLVDATFGDGVRGPFSPDRVIPIVVTVRNPSEGEAQDVRVRVPSSVGIVYVPGSLRARGNAFTDAQDGDAGAVDPSTRTLTFQLGLIPSEGSVTVNFSVQLAADSGPEATIAVEGMFRPLADLAPEVIPAPLLRISRMQTDGAVPSDGGVVPVGGDRTAYALTLLTPVAGEAVSAPAVIIRGRAPPGTPVVVSLDGARVAQVASDGVGDFSFVTRDALAEGAHAVEATTTVAGVTLRSIAAFTVDRTPPSSPEIREIVVPGRVISPTASGKLDVTLDLRGAFAPTEFSEIAAVLITVQSEPITFTFIPTTPEWSYRFTVPLEPGSHTIQIAARDRAGNISFSSTSTTFTVPANACGDGTDNDGDARVDYPDDPDCTSVLDDREESERAIDRAVVAVQEVTTATATAVAETTIVAARTTVRVAERVAEIAQERVLDNPAVEVATERVVAPVVVVAVAANAATAAQGFQLFAYAQHLLGLLVQPGRLLGRRKRKGWGTVYASLTKRAVDLATVRLLDGATGNIVQTQVTDALGRFAFIVERPGSYRIAVEHPSYVFPSAQLARRPEDATFTDLYYGDPIPVTDAGALLTVNVPVDARERVAESSHTMVRRHYLRLLSSGVSNGGLVLSVVSFGISPRPFIGVFLAVNILLYILFRRFSASVKRPKSWGAVTDARTTTPIHLAIVRIFDQQFNKLLETAVTDRYGRYSFLVGKSVYYVTAEKSGYAPVKTPPMDLTKQEGVVGIDLVLDPQQPVIAPDSAAPPPPAAVGPPDGLAG